MKYPEIPIVVIGNTDANDYRNAVACLRVGATDYLAFRDIAEIGPVVREAIEWHVKESGTEGKDLVGFKAEWRWRRTFDAISAPFAITDEAGIITGANKAFKLLARKDWANIVGTSLESVLLMEECAVDEAASQVANGVQRQVSRCRIGTQWYRKSSERIFACGGRFEEETHFYEDITRSLGLERILRESERRYHGFFDTISMGILFIDTAGLIKDVNETGAVLLGMDRGQILYQGLDDVGLSSLSSVISNIQSGAGSYAAKERICAIKRREGGAERFLKATIQPVLTEAKDGIASFFVIFEDISEQKKEKDDLLTSEIRYHQLLDVAPIGVLVLSDRIVTFCNRQASAILGAVGATEVVGLSFDKIMVSQSDDQAPLLPNGETARARGGDPIETAFRKLDGTVITVEAVKAKIPYSRGDAELVIFSDITERKKGELIRRNTEAQMAALFQSAPLTMFVVDGDFNVRDVNALDEKSADGGQTRRPCEAGLIKCANACGKGGRKVEDAQCAYCHLRSAVLATLHTGLELHNREIEIPSMGESGIKNATYLLQVSRIDEFGEPLCIVVLNDITEMKAAQTELEKSVNALRVSQERNRRHSRWIQALYSISREISHCSDVESMITVALSFLEKLFSFRCACVVFPEKDATVNVVQGVSKRGAMLNKRVGIAVGEQYDTARLPDFFGRYETGKVDVYALLDDAFDGGEYWERLKALLLKEGLTHFVKVPFVAEKVKQGILFLEYDYNVKLSKDEKLFLVDLADNVGMAFSNFRLYAELRDSYEKLEQAIRSMDKQRRLEAMGKIASGITHDINNTLVPIKLYTEALIEREKGLSEKGVKYLSMIQKSTSDIENVTSRLRSFYKGAEYTELEAVDMGAVFADVKDMTMPKWKDASNQKGISIALEISNGEGVPMVSANASELREAMMNLVFNAVDAMPKGGTITLSSRVEGDAVRISVEDTGMGMSRETLERCMEPFFTTKGPLGTGLGLAEVYGSIKRFKGKIDIQSEEGKGTAVIIFLPFYTAQAPETESAAGGPLARAVSIMLVDDDSRILEVVTEMLSLDGHTVTAFQAPREAIEYLEKGPERLPDLIITDLGMPEMDGNAFAKKAKSLYPAIPVLLMTGWGKLLGKEIKPVWIDAVINKPPNLETLRSALHEAFRQKKDKGRKA